MKVYYHSPIGTILLRFSELGIETLIFVDIIENKADVNEMTSQDFPPKKSKNYVSDYEDIVKIESTSDLTYFDEMTSQCIIQLNEYFAGKRQKFNLPVDLHGTPFQKRVWEELLTIPYGTTISYKELSLRLRDVKAIRAVGAANGANPVSIIVPCHRVIGSDGSLIGYGGGLWRKKWLLEYEKLSVVNYQLSIFEDQGSFFNC